MNVLHLEFREHVTGSQSSPWSTMGSTEDLRGARSTLVSTECRGKHGVHERAWSTMGWHGVHR